MKAKQYLGITLWIFAVITLLNLYDTWQTLERLSLYGSNMSATQIATWIGIAFTEFVLGLILVMGDNGTEAKQPKQPMKTEDIEKMRILSVVCSLIALGIFLWTIPDILSGRFDLQQLIFKLALLAIFGIIASILWDKAKKEAWLRRGLEKLKLE